MAVLCAIGIRFAGGSPRVEQLKESFQVCVPIHVEKFHGDGAMNTKKVSMRELVIAIGGNLRPTENRKSWLARVADTAGLKPRAVHDVWYGGPITFEAARRLKETAKNNAQFENADTALRFERIADALEAADPEFHRQEIDTYRELARQVWCLVDDTE
jgi:hypothetical protein